MSSRSSEPQSTILTLPNGNGTLAPEAAKELESQETPEQKRLPHPLLYNATPPSVLVDFDSKDDPYQPLNWPFQKKAITTILYGFTTCWITFASAIYSSGLGQIAKDFQVSTEVAASGVSLIVFGFGLGPLIWAPLSEVYGRKWVVVVVSIDRRTFHPLSC